MKIAITELTTEEPKEIIVDGSEPWLASIYNLFNEPKATKKALLKAKISVQLFEGDFILTTGCLDYSPFINCSRCGELVQWSISEEFDNTYFTISPNFPEESDLSEGELDERFLDSGELDIELLLNETIVLAIPNKVNPEDTLDHKCEMEEANKKDGCVFSSETLENQPFASLKNFEILH